MLMQKGEPMSSEEIIKILDEICNRIGAASGKLLPSLLREGIATNIFLLLFGAILMYICARYYKTYKASISDPNKWDEDVVALLISLFSGIGGIIMAIVAIYELIGWIAAPEAKAIKAILSMWGSMR